MEYSECVCCQITTAAIEGQMAPAATKSRPTAVTVLKSAKPHQAFVPGHGLIDVGLSCLLHIRFREMAQRNQRTLCVIPVRNASGQRCPGPTAWCSACVRMGLFELLLH